MNANVVFFDICPFGLYRITCMLFADRVGYVPRAKMDIWPIILKLRISSFCICKWPPPPSDPRWEIWIVIDFIFPVLWSLELCEHGLPYVNLCQMYLLLRSNECGRRHKCIRIDMCFDIGSPVDGSHVKGTRVDLTKNEPHSSSSPGSSRWNPAKLGMPSDRAFRRPLQSLMLVVLWRQRRED